MKSLKTKAVAFLFAAGAAVSLSATPIASGTFATSQTAWIKSYKTVCSAVCKKEGAYAESMKLSSASTQDQFVCRVLDPKSYEYGSNTSDNCLHFDMSTNAPRKAAKFECLCVKRKPIPLTHVPTP